MLATNPFSWYTVSWMRRAASLMISGRTGKYHLEIKRSPAAVAGDHKNESRKSGRGEQTEENVSVNGGSNRRAKPKIAERDRSEDKGDIEMKRTNLKEVGERDPVSAEPTE